MGQMLGLIFKLITTILANMALSYNERPVSIYLRGYWWTYDGPNQNYGETHCIPFWHILKCVADSSIGRCGIKPYKSDHSDLIEQFNFYYKNKMHMFHIIFIDQS